MEIGITGLPSSGKTVVFNALSRAKVPVATYSTVASEPNRAVVKVPDERLGKLAAIFNPKKVIPAEVRYVDVASIAGERAPIVRRHSSSPTCGIPTSS